MLLTITTTQRPATDLCEALRADPDDVRTRRFGFGEALVFFPQCDQARCTAAVLLQPGPDAGMPTPSCMAVALASLFDHALGDRSTCDRQAGDCCFEVQIPALPCVDGEARARRLFEPLGYAVGIGADESLWLTATMRLGDLLEHLCRLLPQFDAIPRSAAPEVADHVRQCSRQGSG